MKVLNVEKAITFYVDTDMEDFGGLFRRGENGGWEQLMGESWETCYSQEEELEAAFQEFVRSNDEVRGASRLAGEASSAEGATSTVVLGNGGKP